MAARSDLLLQDGDTVLFVGDSITDAGRRADVVRGLGSGYVAQVADLLAALHPERRVSIVNRGISGNRVVDLRDRWEQDVIAEQPDWVSISIGVNDVWRWFDGNPDSHVGIDEYRQVYRELLDATVEKTQARLILMETSVIGEDVDNESNAMLAAYNEAIHEFAGEYGAVLAPMFQSFASSIGDRSVLEWTSDGVHPLPPGHMLMAVAWLRAVGAAI